MRLGQCKRVILNVVSDVNQNHIFSFAAALSYYFVLAFFPALIALATIVGYLPIPDLFNTIVQAMTHAVPPQSMGLVERVAADVTSRNHAALLSFGLLGTLWTCSSGFATMIEALNVAYNVPETRSGVLTRLLACASSRFSSAFSSSLRLRSSLSGRSRQLSRSPPGVLLGVSFPVAVLRHVLAAIFIVLAVEGLYFLAPDIKQNFVSTLPGAVFSVIGWIVLSDGLSLYFQKFAHLNKTYGVLGGGIALLVWLYWSSFWCCWERN